MHQKIPSVMTPVMVFQFGEVHLMFDDMEFSDSDERETQLENEGSYVCDHCGEEIVVPLDLAGGQDQSYVEDCPVCCSPNVVHVHVDEDRVEVWADPES